jgi:hypothetical protein
VLQDVLYGVFNDDSDDDARGRRGGGGEIPNESPYKVEI